MNSAIVTGATSFIGVHLIKELLKNNKKVYAIVRPNSKNLFRLSEFEENDNLRIISLNMGEIEKISSLIIDKVDCIYHFAWEGARAPYRDNMQLQEDNYVQTLKVFDAAIKLGIKIFIGSGSQAEYGKMSGNVDENHICNPLTEYGKYKYKSYQELSALAEKNNIKFIWTRIFSVYGKYDYPGTLVMSCIDKMKKNEPINMTKCTQKWDYVYIEDIAKAFYMFGQKDCNSGIYNLASGNSRPLYEFVEEIKEVVGSKSELNFGAVEYSAEGPVSLEPLVGKVEKALGWRTEISFKEGIKQLL